MATEWQDIFCPACGDLLRLADDEKRKGREPFMECFTCDFRGDMQTVSGMSFASESGPADWQKKYGVHPIIKLNPDLDNRKVEHKRQVVDEHCPRCGHRGLEFYTLQLRSADEGQTVFYSCPNCSHKFSQNT